MRINRQHLTPDDVAELAEGLGSDESVTAWREHLSECRSCFASYNDAVRYRAAFLATPERFEPTGRMIDEGLAVRSGVSGSRPPRARSISTQSKLAIAAALVVIIGAGWWVLTRPTADSQRSVQIDARLRPLVGEVSARGLVLPGGEDFAAADPVTFRAGGAPVDVDVSQPLRELLARSREGKLSAAEEVGLLSSLLAADRIDEAVAINDVARRRFPEDSRFVHLAAHIAYRRNDAGSAEKLLRSVIEMDPRDGAARLNLGILLQEETRMDESDSVLRDVMADSPDSPLGVRAGRELAASD